MIKIGLIGAGHLGKIHIRLLKEIKEFEFIGFYDTDYKNIDDIVNEFDIKAFNSVDKLIEQCDAIDIVTPTEFHFKYAELAIKSDKHLFIEKPITKDLYEADQLIQLSRNKNIKIQVGHVERFNSAYKAIKKHCNSPMFIECHRLAEFNPRGTDVPVIHDLMIHDIDIILKIVNSKVKQIDASGVSIISETPDIANARISFDSGCVANLTASRISFKNMRKTRIFQKDAYISVDYLEKKAEIIKMKDTDKIEDPFSIIIDPGEGKAKKEIQFKNPKIKENNAIKDELISFYKSIIKNIEPEVTIHDAKDALYIADQITQKIK